MRKIAETGKKGEALAAAELRARGFIITERNYHSRFGEIDIIAENGEYILFVEVKTRKANSLVRPAEAVDAVKRQKILKTAEIYLLRSRSELQPRFDVVEVTVEEKSGRTEYLLNYIENAF